MRLLYIAHGGFGDVSFTTSWPQIWTNKGYIVDVFLMLYTGNPFHKNPYIKNMFISSNPAKDIDPFLEKDLYDKIVIIDNTNKGLKDVIDKIRHLKNALIIKSLEIAKNDLIPPIAIPEWHFEPSELSYVNVNYPKEGVIIHPFCSDFSEKSRNIDFALIDICSKYIRPIIMVHGGIAYTKPFLEEMEKKKRIKLLWEGYNCFNDNNGSAIGKLIALVSTCSVSIHGWSGSYLIPVGLNKPFIVIVPENKVRNNKSSPYHNTKDLFMSQINRLKKIGYEGPSAWCVTKNFNDIITAMNIVRQKKSCVYDGNWTFL